MRLTPEELKTLRSARTWLRRLYLDGKDLDFDEICRDQVGDLVTALDPIIGKMEKVEPQLTRILLGPNDVFAISEGGKSLVNVAAERAHAREVESVCACGGRRINGICLNRGCGKD